MDLSIHSKSNQIPIPTVGATLLVTSPSKPSQGILICAAEGEGLRFYNTQGTPAPGLTNPPSSLNNPSDTKTNIQSIKESCEMNAPEFNNPSDDITDEKMEETDTTANPKGYKEGHEGNGKGKETYYELERVDGEEQLTHGSRKFYWVIRLKVKQYKNDGVKVVFDFVPEPWLRCLISEHAQPKNLFTAYFLPCNKRFIVIGFQSIQIWELPSKAPQEFKLLAFWSMPKIEAISPVKGLISKGMVYDHFQKIDDAKVCCYSESESTHAKDKNIKGAQ
ncbi:hypothetical protein BGX27_005884, partial [Mortierella sp. AM989]